MQPSACTVRSYTLRVGNTRAALECSLISVFMLSCLALTLLDGEPVDWGGLLLHAAIVNLLPFVVFVLLPRQILHVSTSGIWIRSYGLGWSKRFLWRDVTACTLNQGYFGLRFGKRKYLIRLSQYHKKDREALHAVMLRLFESQLGVSEDYHRRRILALRTKMTWRWHILDKLFLVAIVVVPYGGLFFLFFAPNDPQWIVLKCAIAITCLLIVVAIMRYQDRHFTQMLWHPV